MLRSKIGAALLVLAVALPAAAHPTSADDTLRHHVLARLLAHAGIAQLARIELDVAGGVVTLRGEWPKPELKRDIGAALASVPGVRHVDDRTIIVDPAAPKSPCPPGTIAYRSGGEAGAVRCVPAPPCSPEQIRSANGRCECPPGKVAYRNGNDATVHCIAQPPCSPQQTRDANGQCVCPPGTIGYRDGNDPNATTQCIAAPPCNPPQTRNASGVCACPPGTTAYKNGNDPNGVVHCLATSP